MGLKKCFSAVANDFLQKVQTRAFNLCRQWLLVGALQQMGVKNGSAEARNEWWQAGTRGWRWQEMAGEEALNARLLGGPAGGRPAGNQSIRGRRRTDAVRLPCS